MKKGKIMFAVLMLMLMLVPSTGVFAVSSEVKTPINPEPGSDIGTEIVVDNVTITNSGSDLTKQPEISFVFNKKQQSPTNFTVKINGKTLIEGEDYVVEGKKHKKPGTYTMIIKGIGAYSGEKVITYTIKKADSEIVIKNPVKKVKASTQKKTKVEMKAKGKGKVTYKVVRKKNKKNTNKKKQNANKKKTNKKKKNKKKVFVNSKGVLVVRKNAKKGTYKIKMKSSGNERYNGAKKTMKIKVK